MGMRKFSLYLESRKPEMGVTKHIAAAYHVRSGHGIEQGDTLYLDKENSLHREIGPALITKDGDKYWFRHGKLHADHDKPASIMYGGTLKEWYKDGNRHRENAPAAISENGKHLEWWQNNQRHREDGPAIITSSGLKVWFYHGMQQRIDGPAFEDAKGRKLWFWNDHEVSKAVEVPFRLQKTMILANPEHIKRLRQPHPEIQEYIIKNRPDLIGEIDQLDYDLAQKHQHELDLGKVDL